MSQNRSHYDQYSPYDPYADRERDRDYASSRETTNPSVQTTVPTTYASANYAPIIYPQPGQQNFYNYVQTNYNPYAYTAGQSTFTYSHPPTVSPEQRRRGEDYSLKTYTNNTTTINNKNVLMRVGDESPSSKYFVKEAENFAHLAGGRGYNDDEDPYKNQQGVFINKGNQASPRTPQMDAEVKRLADEAVRLENFGKQMEGRGRNWSQWGQAYSNSMSSKVSNPNPQEFFPPANNRNTTSNLQLSAAASSFRNPHLFSNPDNWLPVISKDTFNKGTFDMNGEEFEASSNRRGQITIVSKQTKAFTIDGNTLDAFSEDDKFYRVDGNIVNFNEHVEKIEREQSIAYSGKRR